MAIDASIYGRFEPKSLTSFMAEAEQLAGMREQRKDNALARAFRQEQMGAARAQAERANALRALQQSLAGRPEQEVIEGVRSAGFYDEAAGMEKDYLGRAKTREEVAGMPVARGKTAADTTKAQLDARASALSQYRDLLPRVNDPNTARQWVRAQYNDPVVGPLVSSLAPLQQALAEVPDDPQQFAQWREREALGIKGEIEKNKPAAPPASVAEYEFAKRQGFQGTFEQWVTSKARAGASQTSVSYSQPVEAVDAQGNRVFIRTTKDGLEPAVIPGVRPPLSAAEERSASEKSSRERQSRQMVSGLEDARAILDAGRATQSGVGNVIDAAARLIGQTTVGAQDAARLEALSGWLVANVPRMEGPQSNFDVQNYTTMAGKIGDRTVPIKERKAALAEVERLQRKYAEINGTPLPAASGTNDGKVRRYNPQTGRIE